MKYLILLRGAMAVGKSHWVEQNNLDHYTISADKLRLLFQSPETTTQGSQSISPTNDKKVWKLLYELVEQRMQRGELTIVDATHSRNQAINAYQDMCRKHRYRCVVVDFTEEATLEEILKRNRTRDSYKFVPENVIESVVERLKHETPPSWVKSIKPNEFKDIQNLVIDYTNDYKKVVVFGDIHSCYSALESYFKTNPYDNDTKYIFLGDLFDRGVQHLETFAFLDSIKHKKNVLMLMGNHDQHLLDFVNDSEVRGKDAKETISALLTQYTKNDIRHFIERFAQFAYFRYHDKVYCCTHGGIPTYPSIFTPSIEYTKGVGKYEDSEVVDKAWCANTTEYHFSIHGHRNIFNVTPMNTERTFNLNGTPEYGDDIVVLEITKEGFEVQRHRSTVFNTEATKAQPNGNKGIAKFCKEAKLTPMNEMVAEFLTHGSVNVKDLGDNLFSVNFDKKVFHRKTWCDTTIKARGLFIDSESNVIARSYDKFFNLNEREETKLINLKDTLEFPVYGYAKENGFLGILSTNKDGFFIASKSTNKGIFRDYFAELVSDYLNDDLKAYMASMNVSAVFEVIDVVNDPHIVEYTESEVILLDVIKNDFNYQKLSYEELKAFGVRFGFKVKELAFVCNDFEELSNKLSELQSKDELNPDIEGYVIEDSKNYAFKFKGNYYNFWKRLRKFFEVWGKRGMDNNSKKMLHTANEFKVWDALLEANYSNTDFEKSLIQIRKELGFK